MTEFTDSNSLEAVQPAAERASMLKESLLGTVRGVGEVEHEVMVTVQSSLTGLLRTAGSISLEGVELTRDLLKETFSAVEEVSGGVIGSVSTLAKGFIGGLSMVGGEILSVSGRTVHGVIHGVAQVGSGVGGMAAAAANFSLKTTRDLCRNAEDTAKTLATGGIDAAALTVGTTIHVTRDLLIATVLGCKEVVCAVLPGTMPVEARGTPLLTTGSATPAQEPQNPTGNAQTFRIEAQPPGTVKIIDVPQEEAFPAEPAEGEAPTVTVEASDESVEPAITASHPPSPARSTHAKKATSREKKVHPKTERSETAGPEETS
ncbi:hypothetical protein [Desulforhabdus sp. TSK]|uniref:hypothetical protein n=1 Tax=Desulforhabdus sp. TSK TaxID=2925014 RepID=UPI001FC7C30F|nr:hypothetical protein [Desulforhabdus sp. TSK]GKT10155.1 hypothetical protein DSTSK_34600 [Desulforhabdus sp. TSK]